MHSFGAANSVVCAMLATRIAERRAQVQSMPGGELVCASNVLPATGMAQARSPGDHDGRVHGA